MVGVLAGALCGLAQGPIAMAVFGLFYAGVGIPTALWARRALLATAEDARPLAVACRTACLISVGWTFLLGWSLAFLVLVLMGFKLYYVEGLELLGFIVGPIAAIPYSALTGCAVAIAVARAGKRGA